MGASGCGAVACKNASGYGHDAVTRSASAHASAGGFAAYSAALPARSIASGIMRRRVSPLRVTMINMGRLSVGPRVAQRTRVRQRPRKRSVVERRGQHAALHRGEVVEPYLITRAEGEARRRGEQQAQRAIQRAPGIARERAASSVFLLRIA